MLSAILITITVMLMCGGLYFVFDKVDDTDWEKSNLAIRRCLAIIFLISSAFLLYLVFMVN